MKKEKLIKLAEEAVKLIKEFRKETIYICGENILKSAEFVIEDEEDYDEDTVLIKINVEQYGEKQEYYLSEISQVFYPDYNYPEGLAEAFDLERCNVEDKINQYENRDEYLKAIIDLCSHELRCNKIYQRLQEIEEEVSELEG